jgi:Predicted nucleic-acid-binding protein containing a Zn-ribbon
MRGIVYTETVVHAAPAAFASEAPYQIVIVTLEGGKRVTGRVMGERVQIDDAVEMAEERSGVPFFRPAA